MPAAFGIPGAAAFSGPDSLEDVGGIGSGKIGGDAIMQYQSIFDKPKPPIPLTKPPSGFKLDEQGNYTRTKG